MPTPRNPDTTVFAFGILVVGAVVAVGFVVLLMIGVTGV